MDLTVDPGDAVPPYEQVRRRLHDLITAGTLPDGERLPPVRQLAGDLGLAAGTVARAYKELEQEGLVTTRRGAGTRVRRPGGTPEREAVLRRQAETYVARARELGFSDSEIDRATGEALSPRARP